MVGSGAVQCQSPACGKLFGLSPEQWDALDPVLGAGIGVLLRCPECGDSFLYHFDDLMESELPVSHVPAQLG